MNKRSSLEREFSGVLYNIYAICFGTFV